MKTVLTVLTLVTGLCHCPPVRAGDPVWKEFTWQEGNCKLLLPGTPKAVIKNTKDNPFVTMSVRRDGGVHAVGYGVDTALPAETLVAKAKRIDFARDLILLGTKGKLVAEKQLLLGKHPGREIQVATGDGYFRARLYLVGDRVYQIHHFGPRDEVLSDDGERFFESFQLLDPNLSGSGKLPDASKAARSFKLHQVIFAEVKKLGKRDTLQGDAEVRYTWQVGGREKTFVLDALEIKSKRGGWESHSAMSRAKLVTTEAGKTNEVLFADAADDVRQVMRDAFGVPLLKIAVDASGKEVKRTVVAGPGATNLLKDGTVHNTLLFHPLPPPAGRDEWQADAEYLTGYDFNVQGKLTYKLVDGGKGRQVVQVSGTLTNDGLEPPGAPTTVRARYTITGEQTYDAGQREWVAGELTIVVSIQESAGGQVLIVTRGVIFSTLEALPGK